MPIDRSASTSLPLAVTMGEPSGIGGEIVLKTWLQRSTNTPPFVVLDDPARIERLARQLNLDVPIKEAAKINQASEIFTTALPVFGLGESISSVLGCPDTKNAAAVCRSIELAVSMSMDRQVSGIVTTPIQKKTLYDAGFEYPGHTEFIAHLTGGQQPTMLLASPDLRVVPVSVHQPLAQAIAELTQESIVVTVQTTAAALKHDFGLPKPRIAVAGLNPHAGEDGTLGLEEIEIIAPAIKTLLQDGVDVFGPVPPDALFTLRARQGYDAAVCHYHDQALIPIKALAVDEAVNVTIGLPIVRTSPDHGTALDIAAEGIASPDSFICALEVAATIIDNRQIQVSSQ